MLKGRPTGTKGINYGVKVHLSRFSKICTRFCVNITVSHKLEIADVALYQLSLLPSTSLKTRNRKHHRIAAKPAACAKPLIL